MKNAWLWLNACLSIGLSSCAFGMGRKPVCEPLPVPPSRPQMELCIASSDGTAQCVDNRATPSSYKRPITNYVCTNIDDYTAQEEWVKELLKR